MNFIRAVRSAFNIQTVFLLVGMLLIVAGLWLWFGYQLGLIMLGVVSLSIGIMINYEEGG